MRTAVRRLLFAAAVAVLTSATASVVAQRGTGLTADQAAQRWRAETDLASIAVVERKVMMPMRDGVRLATDIYRPKGAAKVPTIFVRTPYNFNYWDVDNAVPRDMTAALTAVRRGYAYIVQNERGHYFSEGHYDILGAPVTDGQDALEWISKQPWSNGKVGTTGCSSTAEYQMAVAAMGHPAFAALNAQGFGAGVGRVRPYFEQGNWYRGGAVQMLFIAWLYGEQNQLRPVFPRDMSRADLVTASTY
ncbi:MAG: CocE/NonD family hydrolase, partial [Acidobacteria bacterium]